MSEEEKNTHEATRTGGTAPEKGGQAAESNESHSEAPPQPAQVSEVDALRAELLKRDDEHKALYAQLQRALADFDNFRKRVQREREDLQRAAAERILLEMVEPAENLTRALAASKGTRSLREVRKGLEMIERQAWAVLEANGLRRLDCVGMAFDPSQHEAVDTVDGDCADDGKVMEVVQSGYALNGKVLRCAKVKVIKRKEAK